MIAVKLTEVITEIERFKGYLDEDMIMRIKIAINRLPTIEAEPIRHGKWIKVGDNTYRCSRCNEVSCCNGNFCTDCGARMDAE